MDIYRTTVFFFHRRHINVQNSLNLYGFALMGPKSAAMFAMKRGLLILAFWRHGCQKAVAECSYRSYRKYICNAARRVTELLILEDSPRLSAQSSRSMFPYWTDERRVFSKNEPVGTVPFGKATPSSCSSAERLVFRKKLPC